MSPVRIDFLNKLKYRISIKASDSPRRKKEIRILLAFSLILFFAFCSQRDADDSDASNVVEDSASNKIYLTRIMIPKVTAENPGYIIKK